MTAPRFTHWDAALINLCGWLACSRWPDPNRALITAQVRHLVPNVNHDNPLIGPLAQAAQAVVDHADDPASMQLLVARGQMETALAAVFLARGSQACGQCWPEENTDFTTPLPEEKPHAAQD
jgi:hypothetical protein